MLTRIDLRGAPDLAAALAREAEPENVDVTGAVRRIIDDVRARGDAALRELTARFDGADIDDFRVPASDLEAALAAATPELREALKYAADRIFAYHERQGADAPVELARDGIDVWEITVPVGRAGLYAPGGRAAYPSTVLMTAIPARVAGVTQLALCVPPAGDGAIARATLAAAALAGIHEVYRVGGAQAIAALAYGTETVPAVDVIAGPGNAYVATAKREVAGVVGIDSYAGPSEVVVVADASAPAAFAAADLLAQAEHGPGGASVLVTWDPDVADAVDAELTRLLPRIPSAAETEAALRDGGRVLIVDDAMTAIDAVNAMAPEHLELLVDDPDSVLPLVRNAGAVFLGPWSPAALGDYVAGVNHVLPTARTARFASALRVDTFRKHMHVVRATERGLAQATARLGAIAEAEGLTAHRLSVELRQALAVRRNAS